MRIAARPLVAHVPSQALKKPSQPINPKVERLALSLIGTFDLKRKSQPNTKSIVLSIRDPLAAEDAGGLISLVAPELLLKGAVIERLALPTPNGSKPVYGSLEVRRDLRIAKLPASLEPEQIAAHLLADDMRRARSATFIEKDGEQRVHFSGSSSAYATGLNQKAVFAALRDLLPKSINHVGSVYVTHSSKGSQPLLNPKVHVEFVPTMAVLQTGKIS